MKICTILLPVYNENDNLPSLLELIKCQFNKIPLWSYSVLIVNDGSDMTTKSLIQDLSSSHENISSIHFIRNFGHQAALQAGILHAKGDAIVMMDSDLQHCPSYIPKMLQYFDEGYEYVQMVRNESTTGIKGFLSKNFYRIFNQISDIKLIPNAPDFRLISPRVQSLFNSIQHKQKVLRVIPSLFNIEFKCIAYKELDRFAGSSKYNTIKSARFAMNILFNFSTLPLNVIFLFGVSLALLSFFAGATSILLKIIFGPLIVPGYTDIICSILFLSGTILGSVGIIGRYLIVIIKELHGYPTYIIDEDA
ncbi:MAG: glycosyltransferase [bacterium]